MSNLKGFYNDGYAKGVADERARCAKICSERGVIGLTGTLIDYLKERILNPTPSAVAADDNAVKCPSGYEIVTERDAVVQDGWITACLCDSCITNIHWIECESTIGKRSNYEGLIFARPIAQPQGKEGETVRRAGKSRLIWDKELKTIKVETQSPVPITAETIITGPCLLMKPGRSMFVEHEVIYDTHKAKVWGYTHVIMPFHLPLLSDNHAEDMADVQERLKGGI